MQIANQDVAEVIAEIPDGHRHLRMTIIFADGRSLTFQEATIANMVRAYTSVKTHPVTKRIRMQGRLVADRKDGYAEWQLLETD